jgi:phosphatidate cytidylyltransferase
MCRRCCCSTFRATRTRGAFLVFFLVLVVQTCMVVQHLAHAQRFKSAARGAGHQHSFNWRSWWTGVGAGSLLGGLLAGITPFKPGQALAMAFVACVAGSLGHLVMKALKRDRGIPNWGKQGVGHRRRRPAGPGGCAVFCRAGVFSLGALVF